MEAQITELKAQFESEKLGIRQDHSPRKIKRRIIRK